MAVLHAYEKFSKITILIKNPKQFWDIFKTKNVQKDIVLPFFVKKSKYWIFSNANFFILCNTPLFVNCLGRLLGSNGFQLK